MWEKSAVRLLGIDIEVIQWAWVGTWPCSCRQIIRWFFRPLHLLASVVEYILVQRVISYLLWVIEWKSEWVNEWLSEWVNEWMGEWSNEWVNEWMSEWVNDRMNEWKKDWMITWLYELIHCQTTERTKRDIQKNTVPFPQDGVIVCRNDKAILPTVMNNKKP